MRLSSVRDVPLKFLARIPLDPLWGEPFTYKKTDKGYLLYGLGQDDRGRTDDDADDLTIAVPGKRK